METQQHNLHPSHTHPPQGYTILPVIFVFSIKLASSAERFDLSLGFQAASYDSGRIHHIIALYLNFYKHYVRWHLHIVIGRGEIMN